MIRIILTVLFVTLFLIVSIPILLVEWIIGKFNHDLKSRSSLAIVRWAFGVVIFICGVRINVIGKENIPKDKGCLFVGNHLSYFDIVISYYLVPGLTGYIAKKEVRKVPVLGNWMNNLDCLFLDRSDMRQGLQVILDAIDKIKAGISICIYPEGTRNKDAEHTPMQKFHKGSFKISQRTNCPIIPMVVYGTRDIYENHPGKIKPTDVTIEYGTPVYYNDLEKEDQKHIDTYVHDIMEKMYLELSDAEKKKQTR